MKGDEVRVNNFTTSKVKMRSGLFRRIREAENGDQSEETGGYFYRSNIEEII